MAEINDRLDTALERTRALAATVDQSRANVSALRERARHLTEQTRAAEFETRALADDVGERLSALAAGLLSRTQAARGQLAGVITTAGTLGQDCAEALARARRCLAQAHSVGQTVATEVEQRSRPCREAVAAIDARLAATAGNLERLVPALRAGLDDLRRRLDGTRLELGNGRDQIAGRLDEIEHTTRARLSAIIEESQIAAQSARDRLERTGEELARQAEETATKVAERMANDAVRKTTLGIAAIGEALDALRSACRAHQDAAENQADEILERARRITEVLEQHRPAFVCVQRVAH